MQQHGSRIAPGLPDPWDDEDAAMKIAVCHSRPVPPKDYGGTERIVDWLCKGLVELGHEVTLLAPAGSRPAPGVRLREIDPERGFIDQVRAALPSGVDVVHTQVPCALEQEVELGAPLVTTIHGNGQPGEWFSSGAIFVSANHARRHGRTAFVHNCVDPSDFHGSQPSQVRRSGLVFLSKTSWSVKNLKGAAAIARRASVPFQVAGGSRPWSVRLECAFRPSWKWWGPVAGRAKADLLVSGLAMIFPVLWEEPFGIVVAEALCSGTPVLATPRGSLPELIDHRVGRLIDWNDQEQWVSTVADLESGAIRFDPAECRSVALEKFHYLKMAESYLRLYERRIRGEVL
jgi:glycosyltransferase involved in cell wall biosynthesis